MNSGLPVKKRHVTPSRELIAIFFINDLFLSKLHFPEVAGVTPQIPITSFAPVGLPMKGKHNYLPIRTLAVYKNMRQPPLLPEMEEVHFRQKRTGGQPKRQRWL